MGRTFTFDGVTSESMGLKCLTISRAFLPTLAAQTIAVPSRPGAYYQRSDIGMRQISIGVSIVSDTLADLDTLKEKIGGWLFPDNQIRTLVLPDQPNRTYYAVLDGDTQLTLLFAAGSGTLTFTCPDPLAYGTGTSVDFVNDVMSPNVDGTYQTRPVIQATITANVTDFTVTNTDTGDFLTIDTPLVVGDQVTFDCAKELLQINGANAMTNLDLNSNFFALQPGVNHLSISPTGVSAATLTQTPRWL